MSMLPNIGSRKGKTMQGFSPHSFESVSLGVFFKFVAKHTNKFSCSSVSNKPNL